MKKHINRIITGLLGCVVAASCTEDLTELNKGHDVLTLTATAQEIVLAETNHADEAVTLNWTTGTNHGTGNRISYTLDIAKAGTDFANPYSVELGNGVYSWSRTVEQFNTLLTQDLGIAFGETADFEARVTATVAGYEEAQKQISTVSFKARTYQPASRTLYLIGDATPTGWNADKPTVMELIETGIFEWTGKLSSNGGFKFITTIGNFLPSYNRDAASEGMKLIYRTDDNQPDEKFTVEEDGTYRVTVDLLRLTVAITEVTEGGWRFDEIFFVGNFTSWNFVPMTPDALRPNLFHYGEVFEWKDGGEFKFGTQQGWDNMFFAAEANAPYTSTGVIYNNSTDTKWLLRQEECGKAYKISLDITKDNEKMIMKPFTAYENIYLVGDAAPGGWNLGNAVAMQPSGDNPFVFIWTGSLAAGELKLSCDKKSDWMGAWFMPDADGKEPTGELENMVFVDKSDDDFKALYPDVNINDVDMKWKITQAGVYTITVNQLKHTIIIAR